jgi:hypothetical protein
MFLQCALSHMVHLEWGDLKSINLSAAEKILGKASC